MPYRFAFGRKVERVFAEIVAAVDLGLYVYQVDDPADPGSLRLVYANPASAEATGVPVPEILGRPLREAFPRLLETPLPATYLQIALGAEARDLGEIEYTDGRIARQVFSARAFPLAGRSVGVSFTNRTGQRLAEQQTVQTLEAMTDFFYTLDEQWRFAYLNPQCESVLGRKREELVGRHVWDEFPEGHGSVFDEQFRRAVREQVEVRVEAAYEPLGRTFAVRAYPIAGGLAVYFTDVTEERLVQARLRQTQRLEAIGRVTAGVAHDFNNILTVINGFATLGHERGAGEDAERYFAQIAAAGERATELTRQLLAFAREQELEPTQLDLNEVVGTFAALLRHLLREGTELRLELNAEPVPVYADRAQLEQVLMNLVVNARDATERGTVTVRTRRAGDRACFEVADTGTGIPDDVLPRIFEPFFTTKEAETGTGLGLASVHGIVGQSGGDVSVETRAGEGTTFIVTLPAGPPA